MTQAIVPADMSGLALSVFGQDRIAVLKEQLGRGKKEPVTDAELEHIALLYQRTHLDPLARPAQIYYVWRYDNRLKKEVMAPQISVDGLRLIAQRARRRFRQVGPQWTADGRTWVDVWLPNNNPAAARVGIQFPEFREPTWSVATWREFAQWADEYDTRGVRTGQKVLAPFWQRMPAHMLAKTAESLALRRAFSLETHDLEIARADEDWRQDQLRNAKRYDAIFGPTDDVVVAGNRLVERGSGEVLAELPETTSDNPLVDKYKRNRELVARARELGVAGLSPLKLGLAEDVVDQANLELEDRIARHEFEQGEVARQRAQEGLL